MASNKIINNPLNHVLSICNIACLLVSLFMIQLQLSKVNCTTQHSSSNKIHEAKHFILVHGLGHGAWCWYKLIPLLKDAGHNVTAIDLSASGINTKEVQNLGSFNEYTVPLLELMDSIPPDEKVILVGHSFGGMSLALAMDMYPKKIDVAVFYSALLPDTAHKPSYVLETILEQSNITETYLDSLIYTAPRPNQNPLLTIQFGPSALKYTLYPLSRTEDLELAKLLVRPAPLFLDDLSVAKKFSKEGFGSVKKVYIKNPLDRAINGKFQRWMIENEGLKEVKEINADHMSMISRPRELCKLLLEVAHELS